MSSNRYLANVRRRLRYFIRNNMTTEQIQGLLPHIDDDRELLSHLCQAYNDYKVCRGKGHLSLITNTDALFTTPKAQEQFISELKTYIRDVIGIKREDVHDGNIGNNRTDQKTIKN